MTTLCKKKSLDNCQFTPSEKPSLQFNFAAIIVSKVCAYQTRSSLDISRWTHQQNLKFATNSRWRHPGSIDLLLGAGLAPYTLGSSYC